MVKEWRSVRREIAKATASGGKIVPVFVGGATLRKDMLLPPGGLQGYELGAAPTDQELELMICHDLIPVGSFAA